MLSGIRIVEICGIGPGPFCAMHLADLGADVIAVERQLPPGVADPNGDGYVLNRGKRSITADLKTAEGRDLVLRLVDQADGLIEGMRPGVMERLGLGPEACMARNPRLVYGRMTGWGQSGPLAQAAGHDANYAALSGALYYSGGGKEPPVSPFTLLGDIGGGALYLAVGMLSGILRARSSGIGAVVDAAIVDGSAHMLQLLLSTQRKGYISGQRGANLHDASHFYATYRCADGHFITVGAIEPQFYALLLQKLGLDKTAGFADQWNRNQWPALRQQMAEIFAARTRDEWCTLMEGTDVCFGAVLSPEEATAHPHHAARGTFFKAQGHAQVAPAPRFDGRTATPGSIPGRGQHTADIMTALRRDPAASPWI
ncbi:CoA-transferase [Achromobacter sp. UMC46]|nr:CaiB/BaiF CoA-transferase family protein [Achromobacter sp. UMC46]MBB1594613.1 CoA-transferase [Achromobacter sp. UMC46]